MNEPSDSTWSRNEPSLLNPVQTANPQNYEQTIGYCFKPLDFGVVGYAIIENNTTLIATKFLRKQHMQQSIGGCVTVPLDPEQTQYPMTPMYRRCIELLLGLALEAQVRLLFFSESKILAAACFQLSMGWGCGCGEENMGKS